VRLSDAIQRAHVLLLESYEVEHRARRTYSEARALLERLHMSPLARCSEISAQHRLRAHRDARRHAVDLGLHQTYACTLAMSARPKATRPHLGGNEGDANVAAYEDGTL